MESIYRWSLLYWWSVTGLSRLFSSATVVPLLMRKRAVKCYWTIKSGWHVTVSLKDRTASACVHKRVRASSVLSSPQCDGGWGGGVYWDIRTHETDSSPSKRDDLRPGINTTYLFKRSLFNLSYLRRPHPLPTTHHPPPPSRAPPPRSAVS